MMRLTSVLYVPSLYHSLVSWNVLKSKGCVIKASGVIILVSMGISGIPVLMAKFIGDIPFVMHTTSHQSLISSTVPDHPTDTSPNRASNQLNQQPMDTASAQVQKRLAEQAYPNKKSKVSSNKTFYYWHRSLGHSSKIDYKLYDDGHLILAIPADFTCKVCIMAKSTNAILVGLKLGSRTTQPFELIYSDLSGKQPIPSYENLLYYITFIDDFTWIG